MADLNLAITGTQAQGEVGTVIVGGPVFPIPVFPREVFPQPVFPGFGIDLNFALTGVVGISGIGTQGVLSTLTVSGILIGPTAVGSLSLNESHTLGSSGVGMTGSVGTVIAGNDLVVALTGVVGTTFLGSLVLRYDIAVTNVSSTANSGTIVSPLNFILALGGAVATTSVGTVTQSHATVLTGSFGTGIVVSTGVVLGPQDVTVNLNGVSMTLAIGNISNATGAYRHGGAAPIQQPNETDLYSLEVEYELIEV